MKSYHFLPLTMAAIFCGCASNDTKQAKSGKEETERGKDGTIAYLVQVEASEPGIKIEAEGDYIGTTPCTLKIFGDKDGTFHNFGRYSYEVHALPSKPGQYEQVKTFRTGGWFTTEDRIPKRLFFEMNLKLASGSSSGEPASASNSSNANDPSQPVSSGTGFFISDDGYLITNDHVVKLGKRFEVVLSGKTHKAELVRKDKTTDLALLKVDSSTKGLPLAAKSDLRVGQQVYALGFPLTFLLGDEPKFTSGMVNSLSGMQDDWGRFQFSAQVTFGNSGGALVNESGNVIGVVVSGIDGAPDVNYGIKANRVRAFLDEGSVILRDSPIVNKLTSEQIYDHMKASTVKVITYPM